MGENSRIDKILFVLNTLDKSLNELGYKSKVNIIEEFNKYIIL